MLTPSLILKKLDGGTLNRATIKYHSYRALRKDLKKQLEESHDNTATVSRSKRGEWGEWFENWELSSGEPLLVKEGWQ